MFYLKNTLKNIAEKPYIYLLIFLTFVVSVIGTTYFFTISRGVLLDNSEEAAPFYFSIAFAVALLCCINIGCQFVHLMQSNAHKYSIYRACGADNKTIARLALVDGVLIALIAYVVGFLLGLWIVPQFTSSLGGVKLTWRGYLLVFALNMFFVLVTYLFTLWKASRKTIFSKGVEEDA